jgi:hypothetical protein
MRSKHVLYFIVVLITLALVAAACSSDSNNDNNQPESCDDGLPCSGHGSCDDSSGSIVCTCDTGYTGAACDSCAVGYSEVDGLCEEDTQNDQCPDPDPCAPHGTCDDSSGSVVCECDAAYSGESCDQCAPGYIIDNGECVVPGPCEDYPFLDNSFVYQIQMADENDPCCFDFNGDSEIDNGLGALFAAIAGLDDVINDDNFMLSMFSCKDGDGDLSNDADGTSTFTADATSFEDDLGQCIAIPRHSFDIATLTDGLIEAEAGIFSGMYMALFGDGPLFQLELFDARLEATLVETDLGLELTEGKLGGAIPIDTIWDYINDWAVQNCGCLGLTEDYILVDADNNPSCSESGDDSQCDEIEDEMCIMMYSYCSASVMIFNQVLDIDLDADGENDALSVGMRFDATSAEVIGITP